jgi:hypothetical protein
MSDPHGVYGGHVDTGITTSAASLRTISFYVRIASFPTIDWSELVAKTSLYKGFGVVMSSGGNGGKIRAKIGNSGSQLQSGTTTGSFKYVESDSSLETNRWYHIAATHDPVPSGSWCPPSHPVVAGENNEDCCVTASCQDKVLCPSAPPCVNLPELKLFIDGKEQRTNAGGPTTLLQDPNAIQTRRYVKHATGKSCADLGGYPVQTKAECEAAAVVLSLSDAEIESAHDISKTSRPPGCWMSTAPNLIWNDLTSTGDCNDPSSPSASRFCICDVPPFLEVADPGTNDGVLIGQWAGTSTEDRAFNGQIKGKEIVDYFVRYYLYFVRPLTLFFFSVFKYRHLSLSMK